MKTVFPQWLKRFFIDTKAVAMIEFALILPTLLVLYMGSLEVSQVVTVDRKMSAVAGALGDLVARSDDELTVAL